jgi:hypothetical protein
LRWYAAVREGGYPPYIAAAFAYPNLRKAKDQTAVIAQNERHPVVGAAVGRLYAEIGIEIVDVISGFRDAASQATTSTELLAAWREIGWVISACHSMFELLPKNSDV